MTFDLDEALRTQGRRYHDLAERAPGDLADVGERTGRQRRRRRAASGSALAVAVVILALVVYRQPSDTASTVRLGDSVPESTEAPTTVGSAPSTTAAPTTGTAIPGTTTAEPETSVPSTRIDPGAVTPGVTTAAPPAAGGAIRSTNFRTMSYPGVMCGPDGSGTTPPGGNYVLRDGRWDSPADDDWVEIATPVAYGDLTGDGQEEAVVTLTCNTDGKGARSYPWVFSRNPQGLALPLRYPELTSTAIAQAGLPADSSTRGGQASVADGVLTIEWTVWTPDDPPARHSKVVVTRQRYTGSTWELTSPAVSRDDIG